MTKIRHFLMLTICLSSVTAKPSSSENNAALVPFIINNSGSGNENNVVNNGNDTFDGNLINGNNNGGNEDTGNVSKNRLGVFIINNSGNNNSNNEISNGDDDFSGNLVNGNGNGNNSNSGNVNNRKRRSNVAPFIINNSGSNNQNNSVQNGDDNIHGNIVNGNGNGDNSGSGNIGQDNDRLQAYIQTTSSALSRSESDDELLDQIDALIELILFRLNRVKVILNVPDTIGILLQQVEDILVNSLINVSNILNFLQNKARIVALSRIIDKVDVITRLIREKIANQPEIIISWNDALRKEHSAELELIPAILQRVLGLLRASI